MEQKLNIAEILKDKLVGLKLYSSTFGYIKFNGVHKDKIYFFSEDTNAHSVKQNGKMYDGGECIIFPSKEMRDWGKFSWKKGDILISSDGYIEVIFDKWYDDTYTSFYCKHYLNSEDKNKIVYYEEFLCTTERYAIEDKDKAQIYIGIIEEKLGSILNRETLEIEKHIEFKDGDIVTMHKKNCDIVFIFNRLRTEDSFYYYAFHTLQTNNTGVIDCHITLPYAWTFFGSKMNFATDSEKQQLFDALSKEGKAWNAEKKQIVDIKKEHQFKPFEKVLVRDSYENKWRASFFSHIKEGYAKYVTTGFVWKFCIPYEGNEHLLGTTNNVED